MSKDNGGPAFPVPDVMALEPRTTSEMVRLAHGMSIRDYFAAKAMQGFSASPSMIDTNDSKAIEYVVSASYAMADAMLAERDK